LTIEPPSPCPQLEAPLSPESYINKSKHWHVYFYGRIYHISITSLGILHTCPKIRKEIVQTWIKTHIRQGDTISYEIRVTELDCVIAHIGA
jgi:hypothetical protein